MKKICIIGGTGFVGHHLTTRLSKENFQVRVLSRHPQRHRDLAVMPGVELRRADVHDPAQLQGALADCQAVINLAGILNQGGGATFRALHTELPNKIIAACQASGISRVLHMSALNADPQGGSEYLQSKGAGEYEVQMAANLQSTIFRPSVIFGAGDSFFNRFAALLRLAPCCFPLACANARFAPAWVGDVVEAFLFSLRNPAATAGKAYDLCGPRVYTLGDLVRYTAEQSGLQRRIIPLNNTLSRMQAMVFDFVPGKPFSSDNYRSLQTDSVCQHNGFAELGIRPHSVENIVPLYLGGQAQRACYDHFRHAARRD
jgi:NADH dehydrogenase